MSRQVCHEWLFGHGFGTKRRLGNTNSLARRLSFEPLEDRHLLAVVTSLPDNGSGGLTLREAISGASSGETITFLASLFSGGPVTIQLSSTDTGHIRVERNMTIQGPGANLLTIIAHDPTPSEDNEDGRRIFNIGDGSSSLINVTISGLTMSGGDPILADQDLGSGGAIRNMENLTVVNCVFTDNYTSNGGAIANALGSGGGGAGTLSITDSTFNGNRAHDGGAVLIESGSAVITRTRFENNSAQNVGGAVISRLRPITITDSTITGNHAGNPEAEFSGAGGGVGLYSCTASISGTTISSNTAGYIGGGVFNFDSNLTITNTTISGNSAIVNGGGFYTHYQSNDPVAIRHSTITGNSVATTGSGGGIYNATGASIPSVVHTIVAGNLHGVSTRDDVDGSIDLQFSLIGDNTGATINNQGGNLIGTLAAPINPMLAPLADNGGPTWTHSPLLGSQAINAGNTGAMAGSGGIPSFDQRGTPRTRVFGGRIDIGAVEFQSPVAPLSLVVDIATDEHDGNVSAGDLSLREALAIANSNFGVADTISFAGSLGGATINLSLGTLSITDPVTISGLGADLLTINASTNAGNRIFNIDDNSAGTSIAVAVNDLKLTGANVTGDGGAIRNTESLSLTRLTVSGNSVTGLGGAIKNEQGNLTVTDTTISGNSAASGGGIWNDTNLTTQTATIVGSTISGNSATAAGGGVHNSDGRVVIRHSTITNNTAPAGSGSGVASAGNSNAKTEVHSTIISGNTNSSLDLVGGAVNSFESNNYNLVGSSTAALAKFVESDDLIHNNPMLEALADNGGPTLTHLLMEESPAINAGNMDAEAGNGGVPFFDQRGASFDRVLDGQIDIGAIEMPAPPVTEPELPGDYNRDEVVDVADFVMWVKTHGTSVAEEYDGADGSGDMMVDDDDYPFWTANFAETLPPGAGGGGEAAVAMAIASDASVSSESPALSTPARFTLFDAPLALRQPTRPEAVIAPPAVSVAAPSADLLIAFETLFTSADNEGTEINADLSSEIESDSHCEAIDDIFGAFAGDWAYGS
jgi:hypothetical protein